MGDEILFKISGTNISLTRGDTARINMTVSNADGSLYEFSEGDFLTFTVKKNTSASDALIQKISTDGQIIINPEDTAELGYKKYVYDIQLTLSNGDVQTIITPATFEILPEVSF